MASYKNLSSDWYIDVDGGVGTVYLNGNLDVTGNITYVTEIAVNDAFIIVAANNTGTVTDMGLIAQKTGNTYAGLRFDTSVNQWQVKERGDGRKQHIKLSLLFGDYADLDAGRKFVWNRHARKFRESALQAAYKPLTVHARFNNARIPRKLVRHKRRLGQQNLVAL